MIGNDTRSWAGSSARSPSWSSTRCGVPHFRFKRVDRIVSTLPPCSVRHGRSCARTCAGSGWSPRPAAALRITGSSRSGTSAMPPGGGRPRERRHRRPPRVSPRVIRLRERTCTSSSGTGATRHLRVVILGNVGLPVPEETILALAGYLVWRGKLRLSPGAGGRHRERGGGRQHRLLARAALRPDRDAALRAWVLGHPSASRP